jgi:hypothetical protein
VFWLDLFPGRNNGGDLFNHETLRRLHNLLTPVEKICHSRDEMLSGRWKRRLFFPLSRIHPCTWVESKCHLLALDNLQRVRVKMMAHVLIA